jgi:hypothetical protein
VLASAVLSHYGMNIRLTVQVERDVSRSRIPFDKVTSVLVVRQPHKISDQLLAACWDRNSRLIINFHLLIRWNIERITTIL